MNSDESDERPTLHREPAKSTGAHDAFLGDDETPSDAVIELLERWEEARLRHQYLAPPVLCALHPLAIPKLKTLIHERM